MQEASNKLNKGNRSAHNVNENISILKEIFNIIDPDNYYDDNKKKLEKIDAHNIISKSVKNKEENFLNKREIENYEKTNFSNISYEAFYSLFDQ